MNKPLIQLSSDEIIELGRLLTCSPNTSDNKPKTQTKVDKKLRRQKMVALGLNKHN